MEEETESEHFEKMDNLSLCESDGRNNAPEMDEDGFEMVKPRKTLASDLIRQVRLNILKYHPKPTTSM